MYTYVYTCTYIHIHAPQAGSRPSGRPEAPPAAREEREAPGRGAII